MPTDAPIVPPIRVLIIGAGPAAVEMHLPVLARLSDRGEIVLAAVCDLQQERADAARRRFGFLNESADARSALELPDIDAVYVFASAQLHYEYGLAALRKGKHVFVEKPIAPSYVQACELGCVAREHGLVAAGGHNRRFYRSLDTVRARAGKAGWRFAETVFHKPEFGKPVLFGAHTWLGANGIHALDALVFVMGGLPEQIHSVTGEASAAEPAAFSAVMQWRDGAQGVFLCNNNAGSRREEYVFHGLGETCTVTGAGLTIHTGNTLVHSEISSTGPAALSDSIAAEHDAFVHAIRSGIQPRHSIDAIAPSLFLADLIERGFSGRVQLPHAESAASSPGSVPATSILVVQPAGLQPALARLLPRYRLVSLDDVRASAGPRPDIVAAILGRGSPALPPDILEKLPRLAVVGVAGLSLSRYAPEALMARDIAFVNASAAYADSVAEFALGLAILGRRRAFTSHEVMRRGGWGIDRRTTGGRGLFRQMARAVRPVVKAAGLESLLVDAWKSARPVERSGVPTPRSRDLQGATTGLIGWGANARAFTERLRRAQARVLVYSEHGERTEIQEAGAIPASLAEVLAADIVSLHRGLSKGTWHCLGAAELAKLLPGTVLINVARGALIEPTALVARLQSGDIFACLDTFEDEPLDALDPLRRLPNVFLTSHIAGGSADMHAVAAEEVVRKVAAYLAGQTVQPISAQRLRTMT